MAPVTCGADILVPFINWEPLSKNLGTEVIAPPGAQMEIPILPSKAGPISRIS